MGYWKFLGGVAAGVGCVVALPVAGPVGAVSLLGAAVGGSTGGIAGGIISKMDQKEKDKAYRSGERAATTKYEKKVKNLILALQETEQKLSDDKSYFQLLIALFAVGMATANADGIISEEELNDLNEFCAGIAHSCFPPHVKSIMTHLKNNPPTFNTAMQYIKKLNDNTDLKIFEYVIEVISASDGYVSKDERALLTAFREAAA